MSQAAHRLDELSRAEPATGDPGSRRRCPHRPSEESSDGPPVVAAPPAGSATTQGPARAAVDSPPPAPGRRAASAPPVGRSGGGRGGAGRLGGGARPHRLAGRPRRPERGRRPVLLGADRLALPHLIGRGQLRAAHRSSAVVDLCGTADDLGQPRPQAGPDDDGAPADPRARADSGVQPANGGPAGRAIRSYYALMPAGTDEAWPRMTAWYQTNHAGGRAGYERFWGQISRVTVTDVAGSPPDRAEATLVYYFKSGRVDTERTAYRLVNEGGQLKISRSDVLSSVSRGAGP